MDVRFFRELLLREMLPQTLFPNAVAKLCKKVLFQ